MLIGMTEATRKIAASATRTAVPPTMSGTPGRHGRAEDHEQRQRRQRQRDDLAPLEVGLRHGLHVAVEGGPAGQLDRQARRLVQALAQDRQRLRANRRAAGRGRRCRRPCGGRPRPAAGATRCETTRATCGAPAMSATAAAAAPSKAGVPASMVGLSKTMTSADGGAPSSRPRRAFARADSRSSRMNPPALRRPGTCGASGRAASTTAPTQRRPTARGARRTGRDGRRGSRSSS